ncbi:hypothetical protein QEZ52_14780 [Aliisedimentitalea scapharcae]|uniref:Toxin CptA n=1 Tax=Aliisedimentitalea scapharcae TaxID=1524259 RepID=A0ABZ2XP51_9RHOB|nr:hypothetical protein K3727_14690 [Rhodobacteraceae bacterium M382]
MPTDLIHRRDTRTPKALIGVAAYYLILLGLWVGVDAAWWIILGLALPGLPAVADLWRNPQAGLTLTDTNVSWFSGPHHDQIDLAEIDIARFDTRWDFSIRVTLKLNTGKSLRIPFESLPPHRQFEQQLQDRGIDVKRRHFVFL